jgi:hypothetical protein
MKRPVIFVLLGPIIGLVIMLAVTSFLSGRAIVPDARILIYGIPLAYVFGGAPALFAAAADWYLTKVPPLATFPFRPLATCCVGYGLTVLTGLMMFDTRFTSFQEVLTYGFVGAIPAAICSWLSGKQEKSADREAAADYAVTS